METLATMEIHKILPTTNSTTIKNVSNDNNKSIAKTATSTMTTQTTTTTPIETTASDKDNIGAKTTTKIQLRKLPL